jgi:hypothetical protein
VILCDSKEYRIKRADPNQTAVGRNPVRTLFFENERYSGPTYLFSDAKAFSIFSWSHFHLLDKCSPQCLFIAKAGNACDLLKR